MALTLVDADVARSWDEGYRQGSDKKAPNVDLVRLERWFFKGQPGRLLEYGHGCGVNLLYLLDCGYTVDAVDVSPHAQAMVRRKLQSKGETGGNAALHLLNPEDARLPFENAAFDYVTCVSVLSLLGSRERIALLLREFARVLKPGGKLIADVNGKTSDFANRGRVVGEDHYAFTNRDSDKPFVLYCPDDPQKLASLVGNAGFDIADAGYSAHKYMGSEILEYIVCAAKPADGAR